jgi:hypothetical protein
VTHKLTTITAKMTQMMFKKIRPQLFFILFLFFLILFSSVLGTTNSVFAAGDGLTKFSSEGVTSNLLDDVNPLKITGSDQAEALSTPGGIISRVLLFAFPMAGLILFVMILWGGFEMLAGSATKKSVDAGKQRITAAIIGFVLLFVSYWIIQIISVVFGINIF